MTENKLGSGLVLLTVRNADLYVRQCQYVNQKWVNRLNSFGLKFHLLVKQRNKSTHFSFLPLFLLSFLPSFPFFPFSSFPPLSPFPPSLPLFLFLVIQSMNLSSTPWVSAIRRQIYSISYLPEKKIIDSTFLNYSFKKVG